MKNLKRNLIVILLLFFAVSFSFTQENSILSSTLKAKITEQSISDNENCVRVIFYPKDNNSYNIDTSFFDRHGIEYVKTEYFISADIPIDLMDELKNISGVKYYDFVEDAKPSEIISEGRNAIDATKFVWDGVTGKGVRIAVIDSGFKGYDVRQSEGELPSKIVTRDFVKNLNVGVDIDPAGETEAHGSACAEVIYDIAPDSDIYLLKAKDTRHFLLAYEYCKKQKINIVSCSIGFPEGDCFIDGSGPMDKLVDSATTDNNILSVIAAGNEADRSWLGRFENFGSSDFTRFPNGNDYMKIDLSPGAKISLICNDFTNKETAYSIVLCTQSDVVVASNTYSTGNLPKTVVTNTSASRDLRLKIKKIHDTQNHREMRLYFDDKKTDAKIIKDGNTNPESSLTIPADSRTALTVGAVDVSNYSDGPIASYSSRGPTRAIGLLKEEIKPDVVAPTGVTTNSYGQRGFGGTSAAAPHVAGAAALLLSLDPTLKENIAKLKEKVVSYARQMQSSPDNIYGKGRLVLNTDIIPYNHVGEFVCYPNPVSISEKGYIKITNFPFKMSLIDVTVYTVTGEFVKSFDASDLEEDAIIDKRLIKWDLRNQSGDQIAPGVYFVSIKTLLGNNQIKKIAIQR